MIKHLKSHKNSFVFLETVFALIVLGFIVSSFFKFSHATYKPQDSLNAIVNLLKNRPLHDNISVTTKQLTFIKNESETLTINTKQYTYKNNNLQMSYYE